jgi:hypothetical protein
MPKRWVLHKLVIGMTPLEQEEYKALRPQFVNAELRAFAYALRESPCGLR